jgi:ABC-type multidrug transport system ATPase subunit
VVAAVELSKSFGAVPAVQGVSFEVNRGEIFALLGAEGAGKSTIVRMLCTLTEPSGGRATVAGYDVVARPRAVRRRVGLVSGEEAMQVPVPEVLFLDEPAAGADSAGRARLWHDIRGLRDEGATVVFATSSVDDAEQADRVAILDGGRVTAVASAAGLRAAVPGGWPFWRPGDELGAARRFIAAHQR